MTQGRVILLIIIAAVVGIFFTFDLGQYLTLDYIKSQQAHLDAEVAARPLAIAAAYFLVYVLVTAISLPGAAIMTLAGGAMFGLWWGLLLVSLHTSFANKNRPMPRKTRMTRKHRSKTPIPIA